MPPTSHHSKSTDNVQRRRRPGDAPVVEPRVITPEERRRQLLLNAGVWILVLAFCMTSGIMCFSIGGKNDEEGADGTTAQKDEIQTEIDRYTTAVGQDPADSVALANLGYYWLQKAKQLESEAASPAAKKDDSKDSKVETSEPQVTAEQAYATAEDSLNKALKIDPKYGFALKTLAELYQAKHDNAKARSIYEQVLASCNEPIPEDAEDKEAKESAQRNNKAEAILSIAHMDVADKNYGAALSSIDQLLAEQPYNIDALVMKANIYEEEGTPEGLDKALDAYDQACKIAQNINDINKYFNLKIMRSGILQKKGDKEGAKRELEELKKVGGPQVEGIVNSMIQQIDGKAPVAGNAPAPAAQPAEQNAPAPAAQPAEQNAPAPAAQPAEQNAPAPAAQPAEQNAPAPAAQPAEQNAPAPAAQPAEQNAPAPAAQPAQ